MSDVAGAKRDGPLQTSHLTHDLRGRSIRGGAATVAVQVAQFVLNLASTAILARLLAPDDFGLIAMVAAVSSFLLVFRDLGLSTATIQQAELRQPEVSALFWINTALGILSAAVLAATAPLVAWFYDQSALRGVTLALAPGFAVAGLGVQHTALLRRQMRFGSLGVVDIASAIAGIVTAIATAQAIGNYWALVYGQLIQQIAATTGAWVACRWKPSWPPRVSGAGSLVSFGAGLTGFNVLAYFVRNVDNVILGRAAGSAALGLYVKAYSLLLLPVDRIRVPITAVVIPALSRLQDEPARFRSYYLKAIASTATLGMPVVVLLFVLAEDVILLFLGPQWAQSVLLFRVLAPAAFVETFNTVGSWCCLPLGRPGRLIRWQAVATTVTVAAFLIGARWGALGMAAAVSISTVALRGPAMVYLLRGSPVRPTDVLRSLYAPALASVIAGTLLFVVRWRMFAEDARASAILLTTPVFAATFLVLLMAMPGGRKHFMEITRLFRELHPSTWTLSSREGRHTGELGQ
jgi:O-antigen/teichoic acid export membrane protein